MDPCRGVKINSKKNLSKKTGAGGAMSARCFLDRLSLLLKGMVPLSSQVIAQYLSRTAQT